MSQLWYSLTFCYRKLRKCRGYMRKAWGEPQVLSCVVSYSGCCLYECVQFVKIYSLLYVLFSVCSECFNINLLIAVWKFMCDEPQRSMEDSMLDSRKDRKKEGCSRNNWVREPEYKRLWERGIKFGVHEVEHSRWLKGLLFILENEKK